MIQTYDRCKYSIIRKRCPNKDNEIIKSADYVIPQIEHRPYPIMGHIPMIDEINEICSKCKAFTPQTDK
ncbi:MAG: hypothetical protein A3A85_05190 [Deltaproteobacteria bacterium RIFCSPLOWO2_01_FULL_42_9]|nr:MAG: hypothetical protein A3A85_05190 [Deltaproteobacteria bacterium RIFCSPLOWO2_01_FULL_42_9]